MTETLEKPVTLSAGAARQIKKVLDKEAPGTALRIGVIGGGCSGFQYTFNLDDSPRAGDDLVLERDGALVLIDQMSLEFLEGSEIDYVDELIGASFQIKNPNAQSACGCGTSFSV